MTFLNNYVIIFGSTSIFFGEGGIALKKRDVYVLPDGREFHVEDSSRPAVLIPFSQIFWMGNNTGVVVGDPVVIPDPKWFPEIIAETTEGKSRLLPEDQWPRINAEMTLVRGLAGVVDYTKETIEQYMNRLHAPGIAV